LWLCSENLLCVRIEIAFGFVDIPNRVTPTGMWRKDRPKNCKPNNLNVKTVDYVDKDFE